MATHDDGKRIEQTIAATDAALSEKDDKEMERLARKVAQMVEDRYLAWVQSIEGLESMQAQMVVFTVAAKALARMQVGLTPMVAQLFRAYGLIAGEIQIEDEHGEQLVNYKRVEAAQPVQPQTIVAPGSLRKDN